MNSIKQKMRKERTMAPGKPHSCNNAMMSYTTTKMHKAKEQSAHSIP